jgi:hypothetical protein
LRPTRTKLLPSTTPTRRPRRFGERFWQIRKQIQTSIPCGTRRSSDTPGAALARTRDPLLDETATKIGIDQSPFGPRDGFPQNPVADPLLSGEPHKRLGREEPHGRSYAYEL